MSDGTPIDPALGASREETRDESLKGAATARPLLASLHQFQDELARLLANLPELQLQIPIRATGGGSFDRAESVDLEAVYTASQDQRDTLDSVLQTQGILADKLEQSIKAKFSDFEKLIRDNLASISKLLQDPQKELLAAQEKTKAEIVRQHDATNKFLGQFANQGRQRLDDVVEDLRNIREKLRSNTQDLELFRTKHELAVAVIQQNQSSIAKNTEANLTALNDHDAKLRDVRSQAEKVAKWLRELAIHVEDVKSSTDEHADTAAGKIDKIVKGLEQSIARDWNQKILPVLEKMRKGALDVNGQVDVLIAKVGSADAALNDAGKKFADHLLSLIARPDLIARIVREAATCTFREADGIRQDVVEKLPELGDVLETELRFWRGNTEPQISPAQVATMLTDVLDTFYSWLSVRGIDRFGEPGDAYSYAYHVLDAAVDAANESDYNTIKEVVYSGYRLRDTRTVLRRAKVVVWEKPRDVNTARPPEPTS